MNITYTFSFPFFNMLDRLVAWAFSPGLSVRMCFLREEHLILPIAGGSRHSAEVFWLCLLCPYMHPPFPLSKELYMPFYPFLRLCKKYFPC